MAAKKSDNSGGATNGLGTASNGSSGESPDPGISGGIGGASDNANTGSDGNSPQRIAGLNVADPGLAGNADESGDRSEYTGGFNKDGSPTRKRGRKPGGGSAPKSGTARKSNADNSSVKGLEKLIYSLHMMAAAATKTPELALDNQEASMMASAISAVQNHYDFDVSEEVTIWVNLITASAAIYGPRAIVIYNRKKKEQLQKRPSATVTNLHKENVNVPPGIPGMHETTIS